MGEEDIQSEREDAYKSDSDISSVPTISSLMPINNIPANYDSTALDKFRESQTTMASDTKESREEDKFKGLKRRWETLNKNVKINKAVKKCPK